MFDNDEPRPATNKKWKYCVLMVLISIQQSGFRAYSYSELDLNTYNGYYLKGLRMLLYISYMVCEHARLKADLQGSDTVCKIQPSLN